MRVILPDTKIRGIRSPIPSGYMVGRMSDGSGDAELIPFSQLETSLAKTPVRVAANSALGQWKAGTVSIVGANLTLAAGTLSATSPPQQWSAGTVTTLGANLTLSGGTLSASGGTQEWTAGTVTTLGANLTLTSGTLSASGGGSPGGYSGYYVRPALTALTWYNKGSATATDNTQPGPLTMSCPATGSAAGNIITLGMATLATPWALTCKITRQQDIANYLVGGIAAIDTVSGKLYVFGLQWTTGVPYLEVVKFSSATVYTSTAFSVEAPVASEGWFRIYDDGTNIHFLFSTDGFDFVTVFSEGRTAWLTNGANVVGFCMNSQAASATDNLVKLCGWNLSSGSGALPANA